MSIFLKRKSVRKYDENFKIPREVLNDILKTALRAPSSMNLQPTRLLVIESLEAKEKLKTALYGNKQQLETSSAMILVLTNLNKFEMGKNVFKNSNEEGFLPEDVYLRQLTLINNLKKTYPIEKTIQEGFLDAGLVAMQLMLVAKDKGYDTCAIGGFNKDLILSSLELDNKDLMPVVIISIGKAMEAGFDSYRLDLDDVVTYI